MVNAIYLPTAKRQLEDAVMDIAVDLCAPDAAADLANEVDQAVHRLQEMPYRFPIYHTLCAMKHEVRFFPVRNYHVFYVVHEETRIVEMARASPASEAGAQMNQPAIVNGSRMDSCCRVANAECNPSRNHMFRQTGAVSRRPAPTG